MSVDIAQLIHRGGVFFDVDGDSPKEVYKNLKKILNLPASMSADEIYNALCAREDIMSTAVGNGIALPHARAPIVKNEEDQRICVVYLKKALDMNAPDGLHVHTMFVLLSHDSQTHIQILSALASMFQKKSFRDLLEAHASEAELLAAVRELA